LAKFHTHTGYRKAKGQTLKSTGNCMHLPYVSNRTSFSSVLLLTCGLSLWSGLGGLQWYGWYIPGI